MASTKQATWDDWNGADVVDSEGEKVGSLDTVYDDADSGNPTWLGVKTGLLGRSETLVPTKGVKASGDDLQVAYTKAQIKDAPSVDPEHGEVDRGDENEIWEFYGLPRDSGSSGKQSGSNKGTDASEGTDASVSRSEEEMQVGNHTAKGGRVLLSKHVVTEDVSFTVPAREERIDIDEDGTSRR